MSAFILYVEDDATVAHAVKTVLAKEDATITIVSDGRSALSAMDKKQPDLLLLDILMPDMKASNVLKHIESKGYIFPVVAFTNVRLHSFCEDGNYQSLGLVDYIVKLDIDIRELWPRLIQHLP